MSEKKTDLRPYLGEDFPVYFNPEEFDDLAGLQPQYDVCAHLWPKALDLLAPMPRYNRKRHGDIGTLPHMRQYIAIATSAVWSRPLQRVVHNIEDYAAHCIAQAEIFANKDARLFERGVASRERLRALHEKRKLERSLNPEEPSEPKEPGKAGRPRDPAVAARKEAIEKARLAWREAVRKREEVLERVNEEVRKAHEAFIEVRNS